MPDQITDDLTAGTHPAPVCPGSDAPAGEACDDAATRQFGEESWVRRWSKVLALVRRCQTTQQLNEELDRLARVDRPTVVTFANAHFMNLLADDPLLHTAAVQADATFRDGLGLAIVLRLIGRQPGLNLNGTDLIPLLLDRTVGQPLAVMGTRHPQLGAACERLRTQGQQVVSACMVEGFESPQHYVELVLHHRPSVVVLGMGMPKQEVVADLIKQEADFPCLIICGGAIIDFLGGGVPRAPIWLRKMGCEWAYRLMLEPRRLFARYVVGNPKFLLRAAFYAVWWLAVPEAPPRPDVF